MRYSLATLLACLAGMLLPFSVAHADTISVDANGNAGVVAAAVDAQCSLREAVLLANGAAANGDCVALADGNTTITVSLPAAATFTLTDGPYLADGPNGLPDVTGTVAIAGHGASITRSTLANTPRFRLLHVASAGELTINAASLSHGHTPDGTSVPDESATNGIDGGGIYNTGTLTLVGSTLSDNHTGDGGDGHNEARNGADGGNGGGIAAFDPGTVLITASSLYGNSAAHDGGAAYLQASSTLVNTTLANNVAGSGGGVAYRANGRISYSTISGNSGDGLDTGYGSTQETVDHTIIAKQVSGSDCVGDESPISAGYNLNSDGSCDLSATGDLSNSNPQLAALANNGGPTLTLLPAMASPARNAVALGDCASNVPSGAGIDVGVDQRGFARPQGSGCDIGAVERSAASRLRALGQDDQRALLGDVFARPLVVQALATGGGAAPGVPIEVQVPSSGASAICTSEATDATGVARVVCAATAQAGSYSVHIHALGSGATALDVAYTLTNLPNDRIFGSGFGGTALPTGGASP